MDFLMLQIQLTFIVGFILVYYAIPVIVRISAAKNFYDVPNERKLNTTIVPNLGGIALFVGISVATLIGIGKAPFPDWRYISAGMMILFFIGLKDDVLVISAKKKFVAQFLVAFIAIFLGDIHITNLHGLLGLNHLIYPVSVVVTALFIVGTVNAINLIDGIDGLAALLGISSSMIFSNIFYSTGNLTYAVLAMATAGSLSAFAIYNVFGKTNKIFMGDTGSLIIGLLLSLFALEFNEMKPTGDASFDKLPTVLSLTLLAFPLYDMARLFVERMLKGKSPFAPDKNHVHHKYLRLGLSHIQASLVIVILQSITIAIIYFLREVNINLLFLVLSGLISSFLYVPDALIKFREKSSAAKTN